jgi:1,6-anhydro-N-acetylmuramate kinase
MTLCRAAPAKISPAPLESIAFTFLAAISANSLPSNTYEDSEPFVTT